MGNEPENKKSFVQDLFEGVLTNETRCLSCETVLFDVIRCDVIHVSFTILQVTSRDECFLDLSVDVTQNSSISHCFEKFSAVERLAGTDKFFCDACSMLQVVMLMCCLLCESMCVLLGST